MSKYTMKLNIIPCLMLKILGNPARDDSTLFFGG